MDISESISVERGVVLDRRDHQYSSTTVSGRTTGYADGTIARDVSSSVWHHHNQELWVQYEEGVENCIKLRNCGVAVREGHNVAIIRNKFCGRLERFVNLDTNEFWRCGSERGPLPFGVVAVLAFIFSLPIIGLLFCFAAERWSVPQFVAKQYTGYGLRRRAFRASAVATAFCVVMIGASYRNIPIPTLYIPVSKEAHAAVYAKMDSVINFLILNVYFPLFGSDYDAAEQPESQFYKNINYSDEFQARYERRRNILLNGTPEEVAVVRHNLKSHVYAVPSSDADYVYWLLVLWCLTFFSFASIVIALLRRHNVYCDALDAQCRTLLSDAEAEEPLSAQALPT